MAEAASKPRRSRIRASLFWICIALSGLIAGSWVKSYWRTDMVYLGRGAGAWQAQDNCGVIFSTWWDRSVPPGWRLGLGHFVVRSGNTAPATWRYGGFDYFAFSGPATTPCRLLTIPHWFPLLLCLAAAWYASRPWRKRKPDTARGFEVNPEKRNAEP